MKEGKKSIGWDRKEIKGIKEIKTKVGGKYGFKRKSNDPNEKKMTLKTNRFKIKSTKMLLNSTSSKTKLFLRINRVVYKSVHLSLDQDRIKNTQKLRF